MPENSLKTEQEISECYLEGTLKHSGSISGFIHVFTQLVKNSQGNGSLIKTDVDDALSRLLGELSAASLRGGVLLDSEENLDAMNRLYWLANENEILRVPQDDDNLPMQDDNTRVPPIEEVIAQAAECLADPNFFIAEISGIISALVELQSVCHQRGDK